MISIPIGDGGEVTTVDDIDGDLAAITWHLNKGYAAKNTKQPDGTWRLVRLHRLVAERAGVDVSGGIDHADRNKLNNCRANLRACTDAQNQANVGPRATNTSGAKGVYWHRKSEKWAATIQIEKSHRWLGTFPSKAEAIAAYERAAARLQGEFAGPVQMTGGRDPHLFDSKTP